MSPFSMAIPIINPSANMMMVAVLRPSPYLSSSISTGVSYRFISELTPAKRTAMKKITAKILPPTIDLKIDGMMINISGGPPAAST